MISSVVLDGMNLCVDLRGGYRLERLEVAMKQIRSLKPSVQLKVFVDANLRYRLDETERGQVSRLDRLIRDGSIDQVQARTAADGWILLWADRQGAAVVSGDQFREYAPKYRWLAQRDVGRCFGAMYDDVSRIWSFLEKNTTQGLIPRTLDEVVGAAEKDSGAVSPESWGHPSDDSVITPSEQLTIDPSVTVKTASAELVERISRYLAVVRPYIEGCCRLDHYLESIGANGTHGHRWSLFNRISTYERDMEEYALLRSRFEEWSHGECEDPHDVACEEIRVEREGLLQSEHSLHVNIEVLELERRDLQEGGAPDA